MQTRARARVPRNSVFNLFFVAGPMQTKARARVPRNSALLLFFSVGPMQTRARARAPRNSALSKARTLAFRVLPRAASLQLRPWAESMAETPAAQVVNHQIFSWRENGSTRHDAGLLPLSYLR